MTPTFTTTKKVVEVEVVVGSVAGVVFGVVEVGIVEAAAGIAEGIEEAAAGIIHTTERYHAESTMLGKRINRK